MRRIPTPTNLPAELDALAERFSEHLAALGTTMSDQTRRAYRSRVRAYLAWLDASDASQWHGDPLAEPGPARLAASAYRSHLLTVAKRKPETVNSHLTAVDALTSWLGLGQASRTEHGRSTHVVIPDTAPRALTPQEAKRLLNYVSLRPLAERVVVELLYYTGLRCAELAALDVDDVTLTARTGRVHVREGKGGKPRSVPVPTGLRPTVESWRSQRLGDCAQEGQGCPFIVGRTGHRLGDTGIRRRVAAAGTAVGIDDLAPHTLRHTYGTRLVRDGVDLATVADLMGHSRTETTRRYAAPTDTDRTAAVESALDVTDIPAESAR